MHFSISPYQKNQWPGQRSPEVLRVPWHNQSIQKEQKQATGIYYFPGYFRAKLLANETIVQEHDLFLKSEGWLGMLEYKPVPKYFKPILSEKSSIIFPADIQTEIKKLEEPIASSFHFVDDLGEVSGDDFTLEATIQNTFDDRWAVCQTTRIYLLGSDGAIIIPFAKLGCSSNNNLMLNDV